MDLDLPALIKHHLIRKLDNGSSIVIIDYSGLKITSKTKTKDRARNEETIPKLFTESSYSNGNNGTEIITFKKDVQLDHTCNVTINHAINIPMQHTLELLPKSKNSHETFEFDIGKLEPTESNKAVSIDLYKTETKHIAVELPVPRFSKTTIRLQGHVLHETFDLAIEMTIIGDIKVTIRRKDGVKKKPFVVNIKDVVQQDKKTKKMKNGVVVKLTGICSVYHEFLHVPSWKFEASIDELSDYVSELIGEPAKDLVIPGRTLLDEMVLVKVHASSKSRKGSSRKFLLFNDILVHLTEEGSKKALKDVFPLINAKQKSLPDSKNLTNAWQLQCPNKTITLRANSQQEKLKYMTNIRNTIKNLQIKKLQEEVDQTEQIMRAQVERLMLRQTSIEDLGRRASTLSESSQQFSVVSARLHYDSLPCWKRYCCCCCIPGRLYRAGKPDNKDTIDDMKYFEKYRDKMKEQPDDVKVDTAV